MHRRFCTLSIAFVASAAVAQSPISPSEGNPMKTFASSADIAALIAKSKNERKLDQSVIGQRILRLAPYNLNLEYRTATGPATIHVHEAELFYVLDGTALLVTGGKLVNETRSSQENLSGTGIEGGMPQAIAKGDAFIIPENTPHWFTDIQGTMILMSMHVPRPSSAPQR